MELTKQTTVYKIIQDQQKLTDFINGLADCTGDEVYICALFGRKKYNNKVKKANKDSQQLVRFATKKKHLLERIKQLEVPIDSYVKKGIEMPANSLVLYINPNPRSMSKATRALGKHCFDLLLNTKYHLVNEALSSLAYKKHKSRRVYAHLDLDTDTPINEMITKIKSLLGEGSGSFCKLIKTKGGYHLLVHMKSMAKAAKNGSVDKLWHPKLKTLGDEHGDMYTPVPGCLQGGYVPHIIEF
jgi:hypothetical protein